MSKGTREFARTHPHEWALIVERYEWCPGCGATRPVPESDDKMEFVK